jgi:hypothetical protein
MGYRGMIPLRPYETYVGYRGVVGVHANPDGDYGTIWGG